jgi:hypothetical protein
VSLSGAPHPIWRRLLVDAAMELKDLHQVLQISMPGSPAPDSADSEESAPAPREVYQLRVSLSGAPHPIWRRLLVDAAMELKDLHQVLQISMPWSDRRLHQFVSSGEGVCYLPPPDPLRRRWVGPTDRLYNGVRLRDVLRREADALRYEYDFLDYWCHDVVLERIVGPAEEAETLPRCVAGERACPPEGSRNALGDPADSPCWALAAALSFNSDAVDKYLHSPASIPNHLPPGPIHPSLCSWICPPPPDY